jgi:hypothetical protein
LYVRAVPLRTYEAPVSVGLLGVKFVWSLALQPELRLVKGELADEVAEPVVLVVGEVVTVAEGDVVVF